MHNIRSWTLTKTLKLLNTTNDTELNWKMKKTLPDRPYHPTWHCQICLQYF